MERENISSQNFLLVQSSLILRYALKSLCDVRLLIVSKIADTQFRRQILFQLLILLTHLLHFTTTEKQKWLNPRNRSLQMDFTLQEDDVKWVQDTMSKVYDELRQTTPNSRAFTETVQTILEREKNWVTEFSILSEVIY